MNRMSQVVGKNIEKVRKDLGLNYEQLGELLGVTRQTVSKYIKGQTVIDSARLFRLAKAANVPLIYFMQEDHAELSFMFRADNPRENLTKPFIQFIHKKLQAYQDVMQVAGEAKLTYIPHYYQLKINGNRLTQEDKSLIREVADKLRKTLGAEGDLNIDIYSALESHNIHVYAFGYKDHHIDAISAYNQKLGAFILINDLIEVPEERKIFSVAHELGHLIFHRDQYRHETEELVYTSHRNDINEKVANTFASYFLIPRDILARYNYYFSKRRYFSLDDLIQLKKDFGVSAQAMLYALKDENYIDDRIYGFLRKQLVQNGYETDEPCPLRYIEKNQKLRFIVKDLFLKGEITLNKVAETLDLSLQEARKMAKEWSTVGYPEN